jgi:hypothetical protein
MRLRAGSTAKTRCCDQADNARRPLRRRLDTIERPARVRIRRRKPCTRARRRLFGWKVRLPLATAFSSSFRAQISEPSGRSRFASAPVGGGLAAGRRGPQAHHPGSQPYRRLSGDCLRVLTSLRWVKLGLAQSTRSNIPCTQSVNVRYRQDPDKPNPRNPRGNRN